MKAGVLLTVFWWVAAFQSCQDIRYSLWGRDANGTLSAFQERTGRHGEMTGYNVVYYFTPPGAGQLKGSTAIGIDDRENYQPGQPLEIEYLEGQFPTSRIKGTTSPWWSRFFWGSTAVILIGGAVLTYQAQQAEKAPRHGRR